MKTRDAYLRRKYGITLDDYNRMYAAQAGRCACCGAEELLVVDHCHKTGRVRKLLCGRCNTLIGMMGEDAGLARKVAQFMSTLDW
jgi:hypothetical protein